MKKIFIILAAFAMAMASHAQTTLDLVSKSLQTDIDGDQLYMLGYGEDMSWSIELLIEGYEDYNTYDDVLGIYTDQNGKEHDIIGSGTFSHDEELNSDKFEGTMQTEDGALVLNILMYYLDDRVAVVVDVKGARFEYKNDDPLYIYGTWDDGETEHTLMFEIMQGMMIDKTFIEVQLLIDGGPMQGGSFAQSKDAIITKQNDILTLKGRFERYADGTLFDVIVTNKTVESGLENTLVTAKAVKTITNGQLLIRKNGIDYNATGAIVK